MHFIKHCVKVQYFMSVISKSTFYFEFFVFLMVMTFVSEHLDFFMSLRLQSVSDQLDIPLHERRWAPSPYSAQRLDSSNPFLFPPLWLPRLFLPRSDETYVIGFLVPNQRQLLALAGQYGIRGSREELCNSKAIEELVLKAITEAALTGDSRSKEGACRGGPTAPLNNISLLFYCSPVGALWDPS